MGKVVATINEYDQDGKLVRATIIERDEADVAVPAAPASYPSAPGTNRTCPNASAGGVCYCTGACMPSRGFYSTGGAGAEVRLHVLNTCDARAVANDSGWLSRLAASSPS